MRRECLRAVPAVLLPLLLPLFSASPSPAQYYELIVPEVSDDVVRFSRSAGWLHSESYLPEDQVARWMAQARDVEVALPQRVEAVRRLTGYPQARVERCFVRLLGDPTCDVRVAAAEGLGTLGFPSSVPRLVDAMRYSRGRAGTAVHRSLAALTKKDLGHDPAAWRGWYLEHRRDYR